MSYKFDIEDFPSVYGKFPIPKGTILYYDKPNIYYFVQKEGNNKIFKTTKEIWLYDFRHVKKILLDLLTYCNKDTEHSISVCKALALSYGICSLERQLELVKEFYPNESNLYKSLLEYYTDTKDTNDLVEPQGIRIMEKENDMLSSHLLKYLLRHMVDGTVTNKLYSLTDNTHVNNVEIMLFNVEKNKLLEVIEEKDIQIKETLDWRYWLDRFSEIHYRPGTEEPGLDVTPSGVALHGTINREVYTRIQNNETLPDVEKTKRFDEFAKGVISELVDRASLVPFTPKYTALDIAPWSIDFIKDTYS